MTDFSGIRITKARKSVPVRDDGEPLRVTVVFTRSRQYFEAFCRGSGINPRSRRVIWARDWRSTAGLSCGVNADVVFYDWGERELDAASRSWFNRWCYLAREGMVYNLGEAAMLRPDVQK
jgi:hypothetical protein